MLRYSDMVSNCLERVREIMPWDLVDRMKENPSLMILDVREPGEFEAMHIPGSLNVARGILESACEWDFEETVPDLVRAREREIVVVCRSGRRSVLAVDTMQQMGYADVVSLKTGLRGWNDYDEPFEDGSGVGVSPSVADSFFLSGVRPDQTSSHERS
ncbi:Rhodanese domain protein [Prosthecochloris aestuarii DSM 271]|uniref:Rhodanese domain protein n=1 Tax=Prosthecochloris aestuarii (strain DSM 271 / SK 413) TaxID=290512 RepID=B4S959_PROA2|nr:rhodanese-like domain-containing protein [Prosthecochloris aestuarii]ACF45091.1 Rhodanese domain protein [Prosthecochloris aestuarii DSM 271]